MCSDFDFLLAGIGNFEAVLSPDSKWLLPDSIFVMRTVFNPFRTVFKFSGQ